MSGETVIGLKCRLCGKLYKKEALNFWFQLRQKKRHEDSQVDAVEIFDLNEVAQAQLMTEVSRVARALKEVTRCDKLNIAALGNLVPQLHVHVIGRRTGDVAWPRPVWGVMPPLAHDAEEVQNFISALRRKHPRTVALLVHVAMRQHQISDSFFVPPSFKCWIDSNKFEYDSSGRDPGTEA